MDFKFLNRAAAKKILGPGCILVLAVVAGYLAIAHTWRLVDEGDNLVQIRMFLDGKFEVFKYNATTPAYHALVAFCAWLLETPPSLNSMRLISLGFGLSAVAGFALSIRRLADPEVPLAIGQFFFLPILFPFFFLLYTDVLSLGLLLFSVYGVLTRSERLAGLAGILAVVVRQNQIVWLLFNFLLLYVIKNGFVLGGAAIKEHCRRSWIFLLGFAGFVIFVILNGGVAIGDQEMHPPFAFYLSNCYFSLFLFLILFLPLHLCNFAKIRALVRQRRWWVASGLGLLLAIYVPTFTNTHPYNLVPGFLRNTLLHLATKTLTAKILFFIPIAYAILSLAVAPLKQRGFYLLYPFWFLSLVPVWLIEVRYYLVPYSLFLLFRERRHKTPEYGLLLYSLAISIFFFWGISQQWFFL